MFVYTHICIHITHTTLDVSYLSTPKQIIRFDSMAKGKINIIPWPTMLTNKNQWAFYSQSQFDHKTHLNCVLLCIQYALLLLFRSLQYNSRNSAAVSCQTVMQISVHKCLTLTVYIITYMYYRGNATQYSVLPRFILSHHELRSSEPNSSYIYTNNTWHNVGVWCNKNFIFRSITYEWSQLRTYSYQLIYLLWMFVR